MRYLKLFENFKGNLQNVMDIFQDIIDDYDLEKINPDEYDMDDGGEGIFYWIGKSNKLKIRNPYYDADGFNDENDIEIRFWVTDMDRNPAIDADGYTYCRTLDMSDNGIFLQKFKSMFNDISDFKKRLESEGYSVVYPQPGGPLSFRSDTGFSSDGSDAFDYIVKSMVDFADPFRIKIRFNQ